MAVYEIQIINAPRQRFETSFAGSSITLTLFFNTFLNRWGMDIEANGNVVTRGVRVVPNVDFLKRLNLGVGKLALLQHDPRASEPGRSELPAGQFRLYYMEP